MIALIITESNEKSASDLSLMILRALNNEEQLQQDDRGRVWELSSFISYVVEPKGVLN